MNNRIPERLGLSDQRSLLMSIRYICRPPAWGESITTFFPSGPKRGCVSHRHSPVYCGGE